MGSAARRSLQARREIRRLWARLTLSSENRRIHRHEWLVEDDHVARAVEEEDEPGGSFTPIADAVLGLGRDLDQNTWADQSRLTAHLVLELALENDVDLVRAVVMQRNRTAWFDLRVGDRSAGRACVAAYREVEADALGWLALRPRLHELER